MKSISALWFGLLNGFILGFIVSVFQSFIDHDTHEVAWAFLRSGLFLFFAKYLIDKVENVSILSRIEPIILIGNFLIFIFASVSVLVTFSKFWLADDIRFPSIALGLSNGSLGIAVILLYVGAKFASFQKLPPYLGGITATMTEPVKFHRNYLLVWK